MSEAQRYLLEVQLPDRPGSLGQVASVLGALRGDVIEFRILERSNGVVVDEFLVDLPATVPTDLVRREIAIEEGFDVIELNPLNTWSHRQRDTQPMLPSIWSSISRAHSMAYSIGRF